MQVNLLNCIYTQLICVLCYNSVVKLLIFMLNLLIEHLLLLLKLLAFTVEFTDTPLDPLSNSAVGMNRAIVRPWRIMLKLLPIFLFFYAHISCLFCFSLCLFFFQTCLFF